MNDRATCVGQVPDGGYIVAGSWESCRIGVLRLDSMGEVVWQVMPMPADMEYLTPSGVVIDDDCSSIFFCQYTAGAIQDNLYVLKLSPSGDSVWARRYAVGRGRDSPGGMCSTRDGGVVVVGQQGATPDDPSAFVMRLNAQGDSVWCRSFGRGDTEAYPYRVIQTRDGGFLAAGADDYVSPCFKGWLLRVDSLGGEVWVRRFGLPGHAFEFHDVDTVPGETGYLALGDDFVPDSDVYDMWLVRYDENGETLWTRRLRRGGGAAEEAVDLCPASDGWFIVGNRGISMIETRGLLYRTDWFGAPLWSRVYTAPASLDFRAGLAPRQGGLLAAGEFQTEGYGLMYVVRIRDSGDAAISVPGNPGTDGIPLAQLQCPEFVHGRQTQVQFYLPQQSVTSVSLYDPSGRRLAVLASGRSGPGWHRASVPSSFPSGTYFVRLESAGRAVTRRTLILQ